MSLTYVAKITLAILVLSLFLNAQDLEVLTKDGRVVILKANGTWEYKSTNEVVSKSDKMVASESETAEFINRIATFNNRLPFNDFEATRIPVEFQGHDMNMICDILSKRFTPKDEFETSENYAKRTTEAAKSPIFEKLPITSSMAVVQTRFGEVRTAFTYDADKQVMSAELFPMTDRVVFKNVDKGSKSTFVLQFPVIAEMARKFKSVPRVLYLFKPRPLTTFSFFLEADLMEIWFLVEERNSLEVIYKIKGGLWSLPVLPKF